MKLFTPKFNRILVFAFFLIFYFAGLFNGVAQISTLNNWTNEYHGTSTDVQYITYNVPIGSNSKRVLVVAIASSRTNAGARSVTVTYGGQTPTGSVGDMGTSSIQHSAIYYFDESKLDAAINNTLSVTVSNETTTMTDVFVAVYDGVDQTSLVSDSKNYNSGGTQVNPIQFGTALTVNANDQAVSVISTVRSGSTTPRTFTSYATNWSSGVAEQTGVYDRPGNPNDQGIRNAIVIRSIPLASITDISSTNLSGNARASMTAISLKAFIISTPPNCSTPVSPANNATDVVVTEPLSWNAAFGATGYYLYFGTDASATNIENGNDLGNVTNYSPPSNLSFSTGYYWKIIPYNSNGQASGCATWQFTTADISYCAAGSTSPELYESITNVTFADINNTSPVAKTTGYTDYTVLSPAVITPGQNYSISVTGEFLADQYGGFCKVFIDYDQSGTFDTPGELIFESAYTGNMVMSGTVAVPLGAIIGTTRMRVVLQGDGNNTNTLPCGLFSWGEVEDYSVNIIPLCTPPDQPTLSASSSTICTGESTTLSIATGSLNDADYWQWYSGSCGGTPVWQGNSISVSPITTTTYFTRGEGNSCNGATCGEITVTVNPLPTTGEIIPD